MMYDVWTNRSGCTGASRRGRTGYGGYGCHAMSIFELTWAGPRGDTMWHDQIVQVAARLARIDRCPDDLPSMDMEARGSYWACCDAATRACADAVYRMIPLVTERMQRCSS